MPFFNVVRQDPDDDLSFFDEKLDKIIDLLTGIRSDTKSICSDVEKLASAYRTPDLDEINASLKKISKALSSHLPK
ncbi:MAG: hypothetical protein IJI14_12045 [Anaerolineaceae bacterium]|nr:hypothetical protein [Anaerolineaceae bacterium]